MILEKQYVAKFNCISMKIMKLPNYEIYCLRSLTKLSITGIMTRCYRRAYKLT